MSDFGLCFSVPLNILKVQNRRFYRLVYRLPQLSFVMKSGLIEIRYYYHNNLLSNNNMLIFVNCESLKLRKGCKLIAVELLLDDTLYICHRRITSYFNPYKTTERVIVEIPATTSASSTIDEHTIVLKEKINSLLDDEYVDVISDCCNKLTSTDESDISFRSGIFDTASAAFSENSTADINLFWCNEKHWKQFNAIDGVFSIYDCNVIIGLNALCYELHLINVAYFS